MIIIAPDIVIFKIIIGKNHGNMVVKRFANNVNKDTILIQIMSAKLCLKDVLLLIVMVNVNRVKLAIN